MNFRLQKETQEAQRKRIEAQGVRDFQQIVAQGITPSLLEWKGIEATENLAVNAKVVFGNSKNGLPLILGSEPCRPNPKSLPQRTQSYTEKSHRGRHRIVRLEKSSVVFLCVTLCPLW